ncbi:MAG: pectate lyase [Paludibacteraceae bacterium]|nr:pectate lyase [Paludibacteraceae bacterium]
MKKRNLLAAGASLLLCLVGCDKPNNQDPTTDKQLLAACTQWKQGGGAETTGCGAAPVLYTVSTLEDIIDPETRQPEQGTLRYAVMQPGARMVLFKVAGTIHLKSPLEISKGNITIMGQSAPGDGICIADYPLVVKADNVIIRFLRVRMGDASKKEYDALSVNNSHNVIIDHCSMSWSTDECVSCYENTNFTLQYCFITESLTNSTHSKGAHGYGGIWGGTNATFHHNLLAHHSSRNPRFDHDYVLRSSNYGPLDFVNNVVYNWGGNSAYGGEGNGTAHQINFQNNYYKPGPATRDGVRGRLVNPTTRCSNCNSNNPSGVTPAQFYLTGNVLYGNADVTADNLKGMHPDESDKKERCVAAARWTMNHDIAMQSADEALETVLSKAGCSLSRDAIDTRIVKEVRDGNYTHKGSNGSGNGLIDSPNDVGGWPELKSGEKAQDSDYDGIPDAWETAHQMDPKSYADGLRQTLVPGYTNIEVYLCDLVKDLY